MTTAAAPQGAGTVFYLYDLNDHLLMEADAAGTAKVTYVWRDDVPVSLIVAGSPETVLYLETDHLNTPRAARNQAKTVVWRWESDAFGATPANDDPDGDGTKVTINLRFPGQYYDKESGLHYNWNRYYDPGMGRYLSSDPIGVAGGINTYSYVGGNPLRWRDPLGLRPLTAQEKEVLGPYISPTDLDNADVHVGEMPWYAPEWAAGITRGDDIYFRDPNQTFCTPRDVALLGHELVHVGQYREGMTWLSYFWASKKGYDNNPYELPAYELQRKIQRELQPKDCSCDK